MTLPVSLSRAAALLFMAAISFSRMPAEAASKSLFKAAATASHPDTLEVFVLYVQFRSELDIGDDPGTTGLGTFGSDKDNSYQLDPNGSPLRNTQVYLEKHFDFARDYFDKVSGGRVVIVPRFFPIPDGNRIIGPKTLSQHMKAYNPALEDKAQKQKTSDFETQRAAALMTFVSESAHAFDADTITANNPFKIARAEPSSPTHHHAFMLFHAGHSRLVDGGTLGFLGANTPNDFTDFFVTKDDFHFLDSATGNGGISAAALHKDTLGVVVSTGDTLTQFMMLSEAASQDKVNWGINGILVNQLGRQMGLPDLFDVVKGISQVGYFDVMDFAGYNTMNGFLPVFPSAWVRAYMGWDDPVVARPGTGAYSEYSLYAADQPGAGRTRSVKIPINDHEYLLVENRQRMAGANTVTISYSYPSSSLDNFFTRDDSLTVPYSALDSVFLDSVCAGGATTCAAKLPNPRKPKGIITRASRYDMGLPGNGLLVWHVNEWFLESFLPFGAVNAYLGDTLRSQYKGLELVEADGVPSIGKQFSDALGQPSFDYGTPQDMLPHVFRKRKDPPRDTSWAAPDTVTRIGSYGFASTNSWNDGRTGILLEAPLPASPLLAPGMSTFSGDSVFTVRDSQITLRVYWPDNGSIKRPDSSQWPVRTAAAGNPQALNVLHDGSGKAYVVSVADSGLLQTYTAGGALALAARDTVRDSAHYAGVTTLLSSGNTRPDNAAPVNSLADPAGAPLGACVASDSVLAVLTGHSLRLVRATADSLNGTARNGGKDTSIALRGMAGPMAWGGKVFAVDSSAVLHWFNPSGGGADSVALPAGRYQSLAGLVFGADSQVVITGDSGRAARASALTRQVVNLNPAWGSWTFGAGESFSVSVSDFDRDGQDDVFLLGSQGSALLLNARADKQGQAFAGWPQKLARSVTVHADPADYVTEDRSPPALTDLNRDGHPDIVFSGSNAVYAMDWRGAILPGWPLLLQPRQAVGFTYASRQFPSTVIGSAPLAISLRGKPAVLIASPDGLIYAADSAGKKVGYSSFTPAQAASTGVLMSDLSDWPLASGSLSLDSTQSPYVQISLAQVGGGNLQLLAQTAAGNLNAWSLQGTGISANWPTAGGNGGRSFRLDAAALGAASGASGAEAIEEFSLFPSPLRGGLATVHLKLGAAAPKARIRLFDLSGKVVHDETLTNLNAGLQPYTRIIDLRRLGPDVYTVLCEVSFPGGKKSQWQRLGVIQ